MLRRSHTLSTIFGLCVCGYVAAVSARPAPPKVKIAILITAAGFDSTELRQAETGLRLLFDQKSDSLKSVLYVEKRQKDLQKRGVDIAKLTNPAAYLDAAVKLEVDYFLVVNIEKLGGLAQALFRRFNSCARNTTPEYEDAFGGTFKDFIQTGMAVAADSLLKNLLPQKCRNIDYRYALIALGGGVVCYALAEFLTSGPPPERNVLP